MVLDVPISKLKAAITGEQAISYSEKELLAFDSRSLSPTGTTLRVELTKGAGSCNHLTVNVYTTYNMLRATRIYHLNELREVLEINDLSAEERLKAQSRSVVLANATEALSVIKAAVESAVFRI